MELPEDLPQLYKRHIFACFTQRPPQHPRGSCGASGAQPLWESLGKKIEERGLSAEVGFTASGCLGFCSAGPLMVIYPEGIWYQPQSEDDIDRIFESHVLKDTLAEDLVVVLSR
ncbi:MAG: (2Fe-2S) ferredoxin domain-containing protein [Novosphingobium sp.]